MNRLVKLSPKKRIGSLGPEREVPEFNFNIQIEGRGLVYKLARFLHLLNREHDVIALLDYFTWRKPGILDNAALLVRSASHPISPPKLLRYRHVDFILVKHFFSILRFCYYRQNQSVGGRSTVGDSVPGPVGHFHLDHRFRFNF